MNACEGDGCLGQHVSSTSSSTKELGTKGLLDALLPAALAGTTHVGEKSKMFKPSKLTLTTETLQRSESISRLASAS